MNRPPLPAPSQPPGLAEAKAHRLAPEAVEGRFAMRVVAQLQRSADALPHDVTERLRVARERALSAAAAAGRVAPVAVASPAPAIAAVPVGRGLRALRGGPGTSRWWRLASVLPLAVLVAGLVLIDRHNAQEQLDAAAQIDAELLGDPLPPQVYRDPGFVEFARLLEGT